MTKEFSGYMQEELGMNKIGWLNLAKKSIVTEHEYDAIKCINEVIELIKLDESEPKESELVPFNEDIIFDLIIESNPKYYGYEPNKEFARKRAKSFCQTFGQPKSNLVELDEEKLLDYAEKYLGYAGNDVFCVFFYNFCRCVAKKFGQPKGLSEIKWPSKKKIEYPCDENNEYLKEKINLWNACCDAHQQAIKDAGIVEEKE